MSARSKSLSPHWAQLVDILDRQGITCVLDVGANTGQYATYLRRSGYLGRIISFEPQAAAHAALRKAADGDADWAVAPAMALGEADGQATLHVSAESDMSSFHEFDPDFLATSPTSRYVSREEVQVRRLDSVFDGIVAAEDRPFLKIDTQGHEAGVLDGADGVLRRLAGIQLEMSLVPVYRGEAPFDALMARMQSAGFVPALFIPGYYSRHLGRMLQVDGVFVRAD